MIPALEGQGGQPVSRDQGELASPSGAVADELEDAQVERLGVGGVSLIFPDGRQAVQG